MNKRLIAFLVLLIAVFSLSSCGDDGLDLNVALQTDEVRYSMSVKELIAIKGDPVEISPNYCDTAFTAYTYSETVGGLKVDVNYIFDDLLLKTALNEVDYLFEDSDYDTAMDIAKTIYGNVKEEYKSENGFYEVEFVEEDDTFSANLGIKCGAGGISVDLTYSEGRLSVSAVNQK